MRPWQLRIWVQTGGATATKGEAMTYNPTRDAATAEHFSRWAEDAKTLDAYSLQYVIKDCKAAAESMKGWNPVREGYYIDQMLTYAAELNLRNAQLPFGLRHRI
jgi:hypothetical protein